MNQTSTTSAKAPLWQLMVSLLYLLIFPVIIFFLSGDWLWAEGWVFSIIFCLLSFVTLIYLYVNDPALLNERFGPPVQKSQKSWDKILLSTFFLGFLVWFAIMPLDAKRLGWSPEFPLWIKIVGTLLFILAFLILFAALKENTFAAPVVKMQKERGQRVISTGLYGVVRHPMYLGGTLLFIGGPLLLGSVYGLALGLLLTLILVVRSLGEEEMLKQELEGYNEYMKRVKWRLIPLVF